MGIALLGHDSGSEGYMESAATIDASRVSIVLLNWNSGSLGARAAVSARSQTHPNIELVVVDNGSTDGSLDQILGSTEPDQLAKLPTNTGFAQGMNTGTELSNGHFILLLNCDAELDPGYVTAALAVHHLHPDTAVVGGHVTSERTGVTGPFTMTPTMRTRPEPAGKAQLCHKVDGSCPLHRRRAISHVRAAFGVGPFDPSYDTYGEDLDLAHKYQKLGWQIRYTPEAKATHVRSFSSAHRLKDRRGRLRINNLANRHRNLIRHGNILYAPVMVAQDTAFAALGPLTGDRSRPADVAAGWFRVVRNLPRDIRVRFSGRRNEP